MLPILVQDRTLSLVEVDGQAVVTASDLAKGLEYKDEKAVNRLFTRNKSAFRDFGLYDLTRGGQSDHPLIGDTALLRFLTPSAPDGHGGGLQDVRVFTKRGALKVCMKSNQPKAIAVQEALIDLYEKVESGQLVGAQRFGRIIEALTDQISAIQRDLAHLKSRPPVVMSLPDDTALPLSIERGRGRSVTFQGGLRHAEVRELVIELRRRSYTYKEITDAVRAAWPDDPGKHVSRSAVHRFWTKARHGRLKEFGIDVTVH